ncbi:MAG: SpoIID/LytB domain-containing protein [bacterium]
MRNKSILLSSMTLLLCLGSSSTWAFTIDASKNPPRAISYEATWIKQSSVNNAYSPGSSFTLNVTYKNTGEATWSSGVCLNVYKDPTRKTAPISDFDKPSASRFGTSYWKNTTWVNAHRPSCIQQSTKKNQTASLELTFSIPPDTPPGEYYEDLSLAIDEGGQQAWMYANAPAYKLDSLGRPGTGDPSGVAHIWVPIKVIPQKQANTPIPTATTTSHPNTPSGNLVFSGQGRDLYQGHGLGMSQFGAYGAALKGYTAEQIVKFYYTGVTISADGKGTVNISSTGTMDIEEYVAGLGEIPDKACGTDAQVARNPDKYVVDSSSTVWDCWPEESIKAQTIAARSYALAKQGTLRTDAGDQVYKGGLRKKWAADETRGQVIRYNGKIIQAFYSSDNNQGHGTANHATVWSDFSGETDALPYIKSVNDNSFALPGPWTNWKWKTEPFSYEQITNLLSIQSTEYPSGKTFLKNLISDTGSIQALDFIRDPSERVWKVKIVGTKGTREIAGWYFKELWNDGVEKNLVPSYIYSLTYYLN